MSEFAVRTLKPGPRKHPHRVAAGFSVETRNSKAGVWVVISKLRKHANMKSLSSKSRSQKRLPLTVT